MSVPIKKLKDGNGRNLHDTEKPVELAKILIENSSSEGDTVLDPFTGIGWAGVACKELNRNFIGVEIDEKYFNVAQERLFAETKQQVAESDFEKVNLLDDFGEI